MNGTSPLYKRDPWKTPHVLQMQGWRATYETGSRTLGDSLPVSTMNLYFSAPWTCTSQPPKQWEITFCKLVTTHYLLCPKLTVTKVTGTAWHELRLIHLQRCQILGKQCDLWWKKQAPQRFKCLEEELCSVHQKFYFSPLREVNIHQCKLDSFCKLYDTLCVCEEH